MKITKLNFTTSIVTYFKGNGECKRKGDGGKTIHCLMNLAYKGKLASGDECEEELKLLLKESNPLDSGDWRLDPVLQRACQVSPIETQFNLKRLFWFYIQIYSYQICDL